jgi:hypothetical protein
MVCFLIRALLAIALVSLAVTGRADTITFMAPLDGPIESPPTASPGLG